jgi:hypothetical protein
MGGITKCPKLKLLITRDDCRRRLMLYRHGRKGIDCSPCNRSRLDEHTEKRRPENLMKRMADRGRW